MLNALVNHQTLNTYKLVKEMVWLSAATKATREEITANLELVNCIMLRLVVGRFSELTRTQVE